MRTLSRIPPTTASFQVHWHLLNPYQLTWNKPTTHGSRSAYRYVQNDRSVKWERITSVLSAQTTFPPACNDDIAKVSHEMPAKLQLVTQWLARRVPTLAKSAYYMGVQTFHSRGPHPLLWAGSRLWCGKIIVSGLTNCHNYCFYFYITHIIYKRGHGLRVGDRWPNCPRHVRPSARLPLDGFKWNLVLGGFHKNMSRNSNFGYARGKTPGTLHEDLNMFYCYWNNGTHEGDWVCPRGRYGRLWGK